MNVAGGGGGRTGPYWRRQLGTTLPGERTGQELQLINMLRQKQGLPPIGGAIGDNTRVAQPTAPQLLGPPDRTAQPLPQGGVDPGFNVPGLQPGFEGNGQLLQLPNPQLGGQDSHLVNSLRQAGGQNDMDVRERLLRQFAGASPQPTSREALRRFVGQNQRKALPGASRRPILPPRQALRRATQPY